MCGHYSEPSLFELGSIIEPVTTVLAGNEGIASMCSILCDNGGLWQTDMPPQKPCSCLMLHPQFHCHSSSCTGGSGLRAVGWELPSTCATSAMSCNCLSPVTVSVSGAPHFRHTTSAVLCVKDWDRDRHMMAFMAELVVKCFIPFHCMERVQGCRNSRLAHHLTATGLEAMTETKT